MGHEQHQALAEQQAEDKPITACILTVSDTRTRQDDHGGDAIEQRLLGSDCRIIQRSITRDEPDDIRDVLTAWIDRGDVQVILCTGGTGIARRDTTIEVVRSLLHVPLDGFGELFRSISHSRIGSAAMLSRSTAGLAVSASATPDDPGTLIFAMPGSLDAVETAMDELIIPQLRHLVWERHR